MIGYYVHHHGRGHRHRMRAVAAELEADGIAVTGLGSTAREAGDPAEWVQLPRDDTAEHVEDPTGHGRFHWVPRGDAGIADRAACLSGWIAERRPSALVVDVSVETAVLARLCGTPVVLVVQPGRRDDTAHALAYDLADALVAPWPRGRTDPAWPRRWVDKTVFVGAISRFDGWERAAHEPAAAGGGRRGLVLWGAGGDGSGGRVVRSVLEGAPDWEWEVAGATGLRLDERETWQAMARADVVVTHGGQNSVAEVAAARRRAVVLADDRPFDEQHATVGRLAADGLAATAHGCPAAGDWPALLERASATDPAAWARWSSGHGARLAAQTVAAVARAGGEGP